MGWIRLGAIEEFEDNDATSVRVGDRRLAIYRFGEEFHAIKNLSLIHI